MSDVCCRMIALTLSSTPLTISKVSQEDINSEWNLTVLHDHGSTNIIIRLIEIQHINNNSNKCHMTFNLNNLKIHKWSSKTLKQTHLKHLNKALNLHFSAAKTGDFI